MDNDKRLMEASWWVTMTGGETGSCSDGWGHAQQIFNPIFCCWAGLWSPPPCLTWDQAMVEVMKIMLTSFKRSLAHTVTLSTPTLQQATADPCLRRRLLDTYRQVCVSVCGVTAPFSQVLVARGFVCSLQESVSPVLCEFCNQISLASKIKFPGGSQSLCQIPRLGNLLWVLELS